MLLLLHTPKRLRVGWPQILQLVTPVVYIMCYLLLQWNKATAMTSQSTREAPAQYHGFR